MDSFRNLWGFFICTVLICHVAADLDILPESFMTAGNTNSFAEGDQASVSCNGKTYSGKDAVACTSGAAKLTTPGGTTTHFLLFLYVCHFIPGIVSTLKRLLN